MKLKKVLLSGLILSGGLFASSLSDTTSLIGQISTVTSENRFELMNQIKSNILSLNQNDRAEAFKQMRETRQNLRATRLANIKAKLSPTELVAFEARRKARTEARAEAKKNYRERMANLTPEQRKALRADTKKYSGKSYKRKGNVHRKRITSKTHTTLTAEQQQAIKASATKSTGQYPGRTNRRKSK